MDRDSNEIMGSLILSGIMGGILFLVGLSMIVLGWGPGTMGGLPLMLAGPAYPVLKMHAEKERQAQKASRRSNQREATDGYEIQTTKFKESRRRR